MSWRTVPVKDFRRCCAEDEDRQVIKKILQDITFGECDNQITDLWEY